MKNSVKVIAAVVAMAAMVAACSKTPLEVETKTVAGDNSSAAGYVPGKKVEDPDSLTAQKAVDLFERLAQKETFGFTPLDVYASGKTIKGSVISYLRPYGADGISNVTRYVDDVETVTVTTKLISENETENEWRGEGRDSDWHGVETMVTASYKMAYGKGAFDFTTVRTSSEAAYNDGKYEAAFPPLNWTMSEKTEASELYNTQHADSLFKAKDFISTVTYVAKVDEKFGADSAKFELTNKLTVLSYVVPDPEDQVIDTIGVGTVERRNGKLYGIGRWYARHTLIDPVLVNNQEEEFNASLTGRDGEPVYASNANFKTAGEGWRGVGSANYYDNATNSVESFNNTYAISAAKGMTMSYEGIDIVFNANMVVSENGQTIGASTLKEINGQYYNVYPYSNEVSGVYTVSVEKQTASINLSATSTREIRVKVDEVIENIRRVKTVTEKENGNGFDIKVDFYVKSNIYGEYVKTLNDEFVYTYTNRSHEDVIAESAKESETKSNGKVGDLKGTYSNTLTVGNKKSDNVYDWTLNKKESVLSFNGVSVKTVVDLTIAEQGSTLATSAHGTKVVNNVTYDAYAYKNGTRATLTCEGKKVTKDASTAYDVLVKHNDTVETKVENKNYAATAKVNGNVLTFNGVNSWETVDYVNGKEKTDSRKSGSQEEIITATLTVTPTFGVATKEGLNANFTWTSFGETGDEPEQTVVEEGKTYKVKVRNFRGYVAGKPAYLRLEKKNQVVEKIDGVTLASTEVNAVKAVDMVTSSVAGNNVTLTPKVDVTLSTDDGVATKAMVGEAKTYTISDQMVGTYVPETTREYEPKVENGQAVVYVYDVTDDVKVQVRRDPFTPAYFLTAQAGTDVIAANNLFATVYNGERNGSTSSSSNSYWTVSNKKGQITSTMSNGAKSETNVADFGFDQTITYKDGDYTHTFNGQMVMSNSTDAITAAGNKTVNGIAYEASNYQENFYGVYSIDGTVVANLSDAVKRQILVEVEIEDIVPGTILSVDVRAVAAAWNGSKYINKDGHLDKIKGLAVVTKEHKGAYIPFAGANDNIALPSDDAIKNANYVERSYYDANYVAGYDTDKSGNWQLATVDDKSNQVLYKDNGTAVRSLTEKSMNTWGWSKSEQNSKVSGYKIEVKDGICTIYFNNKLVKRFK